MKPHRLVAALTFSLASSACETTQIYTPIRDELSSAVEDVPSGRVYFLTEGSLHVAHVRRDGQHIWLDDVRPIAAAGGPVTGVSSPQLFRLEGLSAEPERAFRLSAGSNEILLLQLSLEIEGGIAHLLALGRHACVETRCVFEIRNVGLGALSVEEQTRIGASCTNNNCAVHDTSAFAAGIRELEPAFALMTNTPIDGFVVPDMP